MPEAEDEHPTPGEREDAKIPSTNSYNSLDSLKDKGKALVSITSMA